MKKVFKKSILCQILFLSIFIGTTFDASAQTVLEINEEYFNKKVCSLDSREWKYKGTKPMVIDFYATWCGPCRQLSPIMEELAQKYGNKIQFCKVDIDKEEVLANAFQIQSIPTVLFIPVKGQPQIIQGLYPKDELVKIIDSMF